MPGEYVSWDEYKKRHAEYNVIDMKNPSCKRCNDCCSMTAMITDEEYENILRYCMNHPKGREVHKRGAERLERYLKHGTLNAMCPFTTEDQRRCGIYFIRPKVCRDFHCSPELNRLDREGHHMKCNRAIAHLFFDIPAWTEEDKLGAIEQERRSKQANDK